MFLASFDGETGDMRTGFDLSNKRCLLRQLLSWQSGVSKQRGLRGMVGKGEIPLSQRIVDFVDMRRQKRCV